MAKEQVNYLCKNCDYRSPVSLGRCPECQSWSSFIEQRTVKATAPKEAKRESVARRSGIVAQSVALAEIQADVTQRIPSGFGELDRVLGGGIMPGGYVLIGGDPGIGKSTLMLQMVDRVAQSGQQVLYVAGEESPFQIKSRAQRLGVSSPKILIYPETDIHKVVEEIRSTEPDVVVVDSIQAMYSPELSGGPGSIGQMKECATMLMSVAKSMGVSIFLVGHVTKEGNVSGPKLLEHTVDSVLYFEGDQFKNLRILRTVKNRFGNTSEIGVFEMDETGLREVHNPSELFLSESSYRNSPGSVIVSTLEGSRPLLVEIQALVGQSTYPSPRRVANGVEFNRLHQIVAVLERRLGLNFSHQDIYVNVVGGLRIDEPAADLGIALAIITSSRNISMRLGTVVAGEIGLTGEIRPVRQWQARIGEAEKIGFERIVLPQSSTPGKKSEPTSIQVVGVRSLMDAVTACLQPTTPPTSPEPVSV